MTDQAIREQFLLKLCNFIYGPFAGPAVALWLVAVNVPNAKKRDPS
jgi:hypothetical protein